MIYIYDPISNYKKETNYSILEGITGRPKRSITCSKSRKQKIKQINAYIIDDKTTVKERKQFMLKEKLENEVWRYIEKSNGNYISNYGRAKKISKSGAENLLMPMLEKNQGREKWMEVRIYFSDKNKVIPIHKLVAEYFLGPSDKPNVIHKDGNFANNRDDNLKYVDRKYLGTKFGGKANSIPVLKLDPVTNEILDEYESMAEAGRDSYLHKETIRLCVRGKTKTAGGFKWIIDEEFAKNRAWGEIWLVLKRLEQC